MAVMSNPMVAIITRTKDRPLFLRRAMQSVLSQRFGDWLHVIVNDGGDPLAVDLLVAARADAYAGRVKVIHHDPSHGMQNASNAGIAASASTYLVIHDDDDSWYPDFLEKTVAYLEAAGPDSLYQGVATQTTQVLEELTLSGDIARIRTLPYYPFAFINLGELRSRNLFPPIAFLYRRAVHERLGLFRQEFDVLGDHDFNLRFVRHFEIGVIPTFHAYYHWRHGSQGNTVTRGREVHRRMLNRMKNAYYRESLESPESAVGDLDDIEFPPPEVPEPVPFRLRAEEPAAALPLPDYRKDFAFEALSLDIFDTVLRRRCQHPRDLFTLLEARAVAGLGLPPRPYALARVEAERLARADIRPEVTLAEIHGELARLCGLDEAQSRALREAEVALERELLYADPRWLALYRDYREAGIRVVFISDMYYTGAELEAILRELGFADPEVYVSVDFEASKHDGTLQPLVAAKLGLAADQILHIGDNFHSDGVRTWQAGWQASPWTDAYLPKPWFAQVEPFEHDADDWLSTRVMGEVSRLELTDPLPADALIERLGREVAGPLYLSFLLWAARQARRDGVRRLILVGRDGYYWEKALTRIAACADPGVAFGYLHASRKVFNFASFAGLDEDAITFLLTPNPALRVRDFLDRAGLESERHIERMRRVGFPDPDQVLTNDMGGKFLDERHPARLRDLFLLLKDDLEAMFASDREGMLQALDEAGYRPDDCAFVDIGWNASCIRTVGRLLDVSGPHGVRGYFFGTWKEADPGDQSGTVKSFFMHLGEPQAHAMLVRESVNWIESLNAAPFPTLLAFRRNGEAIEPQFAKVLRSGFSLEQQEQLWRGAETFLDAILEHGLPALGAHPGHVYLKRVLHRLLREPSPAEIRAWGGILHSEGFGLEVYKHLIEPVAPDVGGDELMSAYRASNWKRGFLAILPANQRQYVLERLQPLRPRTWEEMEAALKFKSDQADQYWSEKERLNWEVGHLREEIDRLAGESAQLRESAEKARGELEFKRAQIDGLWAEKEQFKWESGHFKGEAERLGGELARLRAQRDQLDGELGFKRAQIDELWAEKEQFKWESGHFKAETGRLHTELAELNQQRDQIQVELERQRDQLHAELERLQSLLRHRGRLLKVLFSGRVPPASS
jgi:glycosyltransferase involved in cell wall biosynthesis/FMN phosphatase YigB (HAD superfamily)